MKRLPLFAELENRDCLVVGGGAVAERRVELLLRVGARVTVTAPELSARLSALAAAGKILAERRSYAGVALEPYWLVIAATHEPAINAAVARDAEAARRFCNVVDDPERCSFIMPAIVDRDPVTIAVSSGGYSPVLARWIKGLIEAIVPQRIGDVARLAKRSRQQVRDALPDPDQRRHFWQSVIGGEPARHVLAGREEAGRDAFAAALARWQAGSAASPRPSGEAFFVGAGPGAADLMTLRGRQLLAEADVVLHDRLVHADVLEFARRDAELISVGKSPGEPSTTQDALSRRLVDLVRSGKRVCRLKGGDPMVFSRIGEELEALTRAGLPFQIVPGISAYAGCAAYAGIPLTLRGVAQTLLVTTGHSTAVIERNLEHLKPDQTLALYMGVANYAAISAGLIRHGLEPRSAVAVVENGARLEQRVIRTTLSRLADAASRFSIVSPALLFVGDVTRQAERFAWFAPERVTVDDPDSSPELAHVS
jgi:uroporphyrin-III C-methyltransferase/precorrin-2 dehydrogenase/sirohydrochlorin ferrochelatase